MDRVDQDFRADFQVDREDQDFRVDRVDRVDFRVDQAALDLREWAGNEKS